MSDLGDYSIEIIVVDNASTDGSVDMVKKLQVTGYKLKGGRSANLQPSTFNLKLISNQANLGFAAGNNLGMKQARGRYLLLLNSDTVLKPFALKEALEYMERNPKTGAMSAKTLLPGGGLDPDCHRGFPTPWASICYFTGLEKVFPRNRVFGQYHKFYENLDSVHEIDAGAGAFLLVRKEVVNEIGLLDENYFFYGEDLDYFYRIKQAGWKTIFYPKALLVHHKGASSGLRKESKSAVDRATRLKVARASVEAMQIFYRKFYAGKYPGWLTAVVLSGIRLKGYARLFRHRLKK